MTLHELPDPTLYLRQHRGELQADANPVAQFIRPLVATTIGSITDTTRKEGAAPRSWRKWEKPQSIAMQMVIEVRGLRKMYGSMVAVDDVSFDVAAGEIFGLLGPNGAGKTTTVECLQGLRHADGGQMRVLGLDPWTQRASLRRRIGSQLQESALPDRLKVWEALDLFATAPLSRVKREQLLEQWGLADKRNTSFANLSGGQRQRLFVALALVNQPEIVFLDEMTTGLEIG